MRIGELSHRTGVSVRLLRYYEEQGLLHPRRRPSGYREFGEEDVAVVRRIRTLLGAGLGTALIAELLPCMREDGGRLVPTCAGMVEELRAARQQMTSTIEELRASRAALDSVIDAAPVFAGAS
ncbi:MerR family transcriptional regulator [Streptomyces sp. ODS28]|uniref:MerR family transcriptional regulator n=1 Tax=Streptomyces sp. ODS28 TaxID=3136688 RepID=UPI0031EBC52D